MAPEDFRTNGEAFGTRVEHLDWIDEFIANIRPYVRVRAEDGILIKMPQEAYPLNRSGLTLVGRALRGESARSIARSSGALEHPERIQEIHRFFCDVRDLVSGRLGDASGRLATRVTRFEASFTRYPVLSEIAVTYRCNLACSFCYAGCGTPDASPGNEARERHRGQWWPWGRWPPWRHHQRRRSPVTEEMAREEVFRVIDEIALAAKVPSVSFTGGECTLRRELPEFIARARERGMRVNIITNGIRCAEPRYVDSLVKAGLTSAQVSLEGPCAEVHDELTARKGSFSKTVRAIANLRDAGIRVHPNTTICEENAEFVEAIIDLAVSLGLQRVSMNHIIPTGTPNLPRHEQIKISYSRLGEFVLRAKKRADEVGVEFHWYSPTPFCIFNPIAHGLGNKGCAACDGLVHVSPSGEVLPCSSFARGVGSLLEDGFEKVWFGKEARYYKTKRQAHPLCRACAHFALCQGACTLYWSGMGYRELYRANTRRALSRTRKILGLHRSS